MLIDIVYNITYFIHYDDVKSFCLTNHYYHEMIHDVIHYKQKLNPFPRASGRCQWYKIKNELPFTVYHWNIMMKHLDDCKNLLNKNKINLDLIYGDIVEFKATALDQPHILIYNGHEFEHLDYDEYCLEILPQKYKHIDNLVPVNYWQYDCFNHMTDLTPFVINFHFNDDIKNMVYHNIKNDGYIKNKKDIYWKSHFYYNLYIYHIYFIYSWSHKKDCYKFAKTTSFTLDQIRDLLDYNNDLKSFNKNTLLMFI